MVWGYKEATPHGVIECVDMKGAPFAADPPPIVYDDGNDDDHEDKDDRDDDRDEDEREECEAEEDGRLRRPLLRVRDARRVLLHRVVVIVFALVVGCNDATIDRLQPKRVQSRTSRG